MIYLYTYIGNINISKNKLKIMGSANIFYDRVKIGYPPI